MATKPDWDAAARRRRAERNGTVPSGLMTAPRKGAAKKGLSIDRKVTWTEYCIHCGQRIAINLLGEHQSTCGQTPPKDPVPIFDRRVFDTLSPNGAMWWLAANRCRMDSIFPRALLLLKMCVECERATKPYLNTLCSDIKTALGGPVSCECVDSTMTQIIHMIKARELDPE